MDIPQLGFGTYKIDNDAAPKAVASALEVGYRHIDTAQMYGNEAGVGRALAATDIPREDIFVTTKLNTPNHRPDDVRRTFAQSLVDLQTDYVDLFLIHWPMPMFYGGDFITTYRVMEEFVASGQARAIGVSNFEAHHLEKLLSGTSILPAVNQIELHPYFSNSELAAFCSEREIAVEAWSPRRRAPRRRRWCSPGTLPRATSRSRSPYTWSAKRRTSPPRVSRCPRNRSSASMRSIRANPAARASTRTSSTACRYSSLGPAGTKIVWAGRADRGHS